MTTQEKDLSYLSDKKNKGPLSNSEAKTLEKLLEVFGNKFKIITIEGDYVYGYINNKRKYLSTKAEYYKYKILKQRTKKQKNDEEEKARENFKKSYKKTEPEPSLESNLETDSESDLESNLSEDT